MKLLIMILLVSVVGFFLLEMLKLEDEEIHMDPHSFTIECQIIKILLQHGYEFYDVFRENYNEAVFHRLLTKEQQLSLLHRVREYFNRHEKPDVNEFRKWITDDDYSNEELIRRIQEAKDRLSNISLYKKTIKELEPIETIMQRVQSTIDNIPDESLKQKFYTLLDEIDSLPEAWKTFVIRNFLSELKYTGDKQYLSRIYNELSALVKTYLRSSPC